MAGLGFGLAAAGGAMGDELQEMLTRAFMQKLERDQLAEQQRQADMRQSIAQGGLQQGQQRIDLDREQFGENTRRFNVTDARDAEMHPLRIANVKAQTGEIERKPLAEEQGRAHDVFMTNLGGKIRSGHIAQGAAEDRRTIASRPQATAGGWQLQQVTNPTTNVTELVRVNDVTGEVQKVNLPAGTQPGGARQKSLGVSQQEDLSTMKTVEDMIGQVRQIGSATGGKGIGGLGQGTIGRIKMSQLGMGDPREEQLRNFVGNIQGTIAKLRGGTSFTVNEQKLLDSYTPTINENWKSVQAKLESLEKFIQLKRDNMLQFAGAAPGGASAPASAPQEYDYVPGKGLVPRGSR